MVLDSCRRQESCHTGQYVGSSCAERGFHHSYWPILRRARLRAPNSESAIYWQTIPVLLRDWNVLWRILSKFCKEIRNTCELNNTNLAYCPYLLWYADFIICDSSYLDLQNKRQDWWDCTLENKSREWILWGALFRPKRGPDYRGRWWLRSLCREFGRSQSAWLLGYHRRENLCGNCTCGIQRLICSDVAWNILHGLKAVYVKPSYFYLAASPGTLNVYYTCIFFFLSYA
jgi:hypothetical protein